RDDLVTGVQTCALPIYVLENLAVLARERLEAAARLLARAPHLIEIELVEEREQPHHADRVAFPRRVEFLLFLKERRELFAHEERSEERRVGKACGTAWE